MAGLGEVRRALYPDGYADVLADARVGVAGLGGMGSNIAQSLVRAGIGHLVIADFDTVDASNITRQNYFFRDIGRRKADATLDILRMIDPDADVVAHDVRLDRENACSVFHGCSIVCEALDSPDQKSMLVETLLRGDPDVIVVSCSGMAGFGDPNYIRTDRRMSRLHVSGDGESDAFAGIGLVSPRVLVCAGHEAMTAIRILLGLA